MSNTFIPTLEHSQNYLENDELIVLSQESIKLVQYVNIREGHFQTGYFIGLSWVLDKKKVLHVKPKLDKETDKIDFLKMLSICFKHPETLKYIDDLFEINFQEPLIKIPQQHDMITPLLLVHFLQLVQIIVKKGLKKGYYKVENNLYATIKGKVLVPKTFKSNTLKNKSLHTFCTYDEFGINYPENRIIKKALLFVLRYSKLSKTNLLDLSSILNYILPAFEKVDENISVHNVKAVKHNPFFSEYAKAVDVAIMILKRFGFNINSINEDNEIATPPFWINMPQLFEIYVLGLLKNAFGDKEILFQADIKYGDIDFLRITNGKKMVLDAKYKPKYQSNNYDISDIRQLSAYARDKGTMNTLSIPKENRINTLLDCIIIYPDSNASSEISEDDLMKNPISQFERFYKVGVSIPVIKPPKR